MGKKGVGGWQEVWAVGKKGGEMARGWVSKKDMTGGSMKGVASEACGGQSVGV